MANRCITFVFFCLMPLGLGLFGCAAHQGEAEQVRRLEEYTEVMELRMTNFEERLTLVEQEVGILHSRGALPKGARRVDPAPSLAKFPNLAGAHEVLADTGMAGTAVAATSGGTAATARTAPSRHVPAQPAGESALVGSYGQQPSYTSQPPESRSLSRPVTQGRVELGESAQSGAGTVSSSEAPVLLPPRVAETDSAAHVQPGLQPGQQPEQQPGLPPGQQFTEIAPATGSARTSAPERGGGRPVAPVPPKTSAATSTASVPASLRGLPSGFRTGVRAYDEALAMYYRHEYANSRQAFTRFIQGNKGHKLLPNAFYWQGENAYSQADYVSAILSFKTITSQYPKHPKAADALLKIGMSYERLKDSGNAQFYWQVLLDDFPKSSAARVARGYMRR